MASPRRLRRRNAALVTAAALIGLTILTSCVTPTPPPAPTRLPAGRYTSMVFSDAQLTRTTNVVFGGGPDLVTGAPVTLTLDTYAPSTAADPQPTGRPAIVWLYGGGFAGGRKEDVGGTASEYARRGYVTIAPNYRVDPGNDCQAVQHGTTTDITRCAAAIWGAQHDAQAAVRWVRAHAAQLGVDPNKIAAGGFSAGAITALNLAYHADDPGTSGNPGYSSRVSAAVAASGCEEDPTVIGLWDAPVSIIASHDDPAVFYSCTAQTVATARAAGLVADLHDYPGALHAGDLYLAHKATTDAQWATFLTTWLKL